MEASLDEVVLCDTTFVSVVQSAEKHAGIIDAWPEAVRERLDQAVKAISVIALAELRDGHIYAGWGKARRDRAEHLIAAYLLIPIDMSILDRLAQLRARRAGWNVGDHDLWIAATAIERDWTLVSCDQDFDRVDGLDHICLPV